MQSVLNALPSAHAFPSRSHPKRSPFWRTDASAHRKPESAPRTPPQRTGHALARGPVPSPARTRHRHQFFHEWHVWRTGTAAHARELQTLWRLQQLRLGAIVSDNHRTQPFARCHYDAALPGTGAAACVLDREIAGTLENVRAHTRRHSTLDEPARAHLRVAIAAGDRWCSLAGCGRGRIYQSK